MSTNPPQQPMDIVLDQAMFDLFQTDLETQILALNHDLVELEQHPHDNRLYSSLMRAAHSIKGASRIIGLYPFVALAHAMEDCFSAAQEGHLELSSAKIDELLQSVDLLTRLFKISLNELQNWLKASEKTIKTLIEKISNVGVLTSEKGNQSPVPPSLQHVFKVGTAFKPAVKQERVLRVTAENLNRLLGIARESMVESRWLYSFAGFIQELKQSHDELTEQMDDLRNALPTATHISMQENFTHIQDKFNHCRSALRERSADLDTFMHQHASLSDRMYQEAVNSRMCTFGEGVETFPRVVRDLARELGKKVHLEILGKSTTIDRDILEKLQSPLIHLLWNAVDHGIETPEERVRLGKPEEGVIRLETSHHGGSLLITVSDDGKGIDLAELRNHLIDKNLVSVQNAAKLNDEELLAFLFLPGFSTASTLTEISGRGMGLNILQNAVEEFGGLIQTISQVGRGTTFILQLPLSLAIIHALVVRISGEPYAFPLVRINRATYIPQDQVTILENRPFISLDGKSIGLIYGSQVLELNDSQPNMSLLPVVIIGEEPNSFGIVVDAIIGEKELFVQPLHLKVENFPDIIAGALMEDGSPVLIVEVSELLLYVNRLLLSPEVPAFPRLAAATPEKKIRILIADDSMTVREAQRRLLRQCGYEVEMAPDGMTAWNAIRANPPDLVITDISMPKMDGLELIRHIRNDSHLAAIPILVMSYKDEDADIAKGLEAGANTYYAKTTFDEKTFLETIRNLIGLPSR